MTWLIILIYLIVGYLLSQVTNFKPCLANIICRRFVNAQLFDYLLPHHYYYSVPKSTRIPDLLYLCGNNYPLTDKRTVYCCILACPAGWILQYPIQYPIGSHIGCITRFRALVNVALFFFCDNYWFIECYNYLISNLNFGNHNQFILNNPILFQITNLLH